jgi:7-cyano-7-deazaguanine synthase
MCSIFGWLSGVSSDTKQAIVLKGLQRGRDGFGIQNIKTKQYFRAINVLDIGLKTILEQEAVIGNFRATPTTEAISETDLLQPYGSYVHNGTIANDKQFGEFTIDSMCLPIVLDNSSLQSFFNTVQKLKGSYAIATYNESEVLLACNYKPLYYKAENGGFAFASTFDMLGEGAVKMQPYSCLSYNFKTNSIIKLVIPREQPKKVLISCSGGLDSVTVAYMLKEQGYDVALVYFLYGCKAENKEKQRVEQIAAHGGFSLMFAELPKVFSGTIVSNTYHKQGIEASEYAYDWVSARNLLMLSTLTAMAETHKYGYIAFGGNLEEAGSYPDNEQEFGNLFNAILPYATQNGYAVELLQPLSTFMKHEIVSEGIRLNVPYELTWSCYGDGDNHCGECGPCFMRKTAFKRNSENDPCMI